MNTLMSGFYVSANDTIVEFTVANNQERIQFKFNNDKFNVLCGLVEMYLLGECNKGVVGPVSSTFSVCGMLIGEGKKEENNIRKNYLIKSVEDIPDEF